VDLRYGFLEEYQWLSAFDKFMVVQSTEDCNMYDTDIQTTISIMGHIVFLEYKLSKDWAVEWWLNRGCYGDCVEPEIMAVGTELLESLLRTHWSGFIEQRLMDEFGSRQYAEEAKLSKEDIPF
jgi:hypothetical protein